MTAAAARPKSANLLVEIGTEELPPGTLSALGRAFAEALCRGLAEAGLRAEPDLQPRWFASPRRLAAWIPSVLDKQPDQQVERRGPAVAAAFDRQGRATKAATGFARSCGVDVDQLAQVRDSKGARLMYRVTRSGEAAAALIPKCVEYAVKQLPIRKRMRWGDGAAEFVRPVHWLVVIHGRRPVKTEMLSVTSDVYTRGHRFHCERRLRVTDADDYERLLKEDGFVIPAFDDRRQRIERHVRRIAKRQNAIPVSDPALLNEVTGLVEWPVPVLGEFDRAFLELPPEVLVSSMRDHQKYFPLADDNGRLQPFFITLSNIKSKRPGRVREGNERVLRARLSDARFFWETDRKQPLRARVDALRGVLFHRKLGSMFDKSERVRALSAVIASGCGADVQHCESAASLAKADLVTEMVGEFPELQGVMGRYYAAHDGEPAAVARAIEEHYLPRFAGDRLPRSGVGQVLAIADRLDTLVGIFSAGEEPSGDKDPYALRRAALGVLRILTEKGLGFDLFALLRDAVRIYRQQDASPAVPDDVADRVFEFMLERQRAFYVAADFQADEVNAVISTRPVSPLDFEKRLRAVAEFRRRPEAANLTAANKRIRNILRKSKQTVPAKIDESVLTEPEEIRLYEALQKLSRRAQKHFDDGRYDRGLTKLVALKDPVDRFFDQVLVMTDDEVIRGNRLALLTRIQELFLRTADVSKLQDSGG